MLTRDHLYSYQKDFVEHVKGGASSLGFIEVGLGKTVSTMTAISDMMLEDRRQGNLRRALVIAPKRVARDVWPKEPKKWAHLRHMRVVSAIGPARVRKNAIWNMSADIVTINYENIPWLLENVPRGAMPFYFLVLDELDKMKSVGTERFSKMRHRLDDFEVRVGLTGTPVPETLLNIWAQQFLICGERIDGRRWDSPLGPTFSAFKRNWFSSDWTGYKYEAMEGAVDHVRQALAPYVFTARAKDHLDLPPLIVNDIVFDLPKKAREVYEELEAKLIVALRNGEAVELDEQGEIIEASNAAVLVNKLRQVCSGFLYDEDHEAIALHGQKTSIFEDLQSQLQGEQLLAVYGFQAEAAKIHYDGALAGWTSDREEREALDAWDAGRIQTLAMHPASAGHGLNLHTSGAHNICFLTLPWSRGLYDQTIGRLKRMGQENRVIVHRLLARDTIEERVAKALEGKGAVQDAVLEAMKGKR